MKTKINALLCLLVMAVAGCVAMHPQGSARLTPDAIVSAKGIVLRDGDRLSTPESFKPPVEITIVAKTDSTNLRMAYAADQVIFNWEMDREQLRIDGGPANGLHKAGAGNIPMGTFVTIRWLVTPKHQAIYVNDELRFEHDGDYSHLNNCVSVFPAAGSQVAVKAIKVKRIDAAAASTHEKLLCLTANVDGSGRFIFTRDSAHYEHKHWSPPVDVALNGEAWSDLARTPASWSEFCRGLDLSRARIVKREGRDIAALEPTSAGFDLYLDDSPNGSADYAVTIAIPRRK
jgi:hypothetical protein